MDSVPWIEFASTPPSPLKSDLIPLRDRPCLPFSLPPLSEMQARVMRASFDPAEKERGIWTSTECKQSWLL